MTVDMTVAGGADVAGEPALEQTMGVPR